MVNIAIHGLGRIGRSILRRSSLDSSLNVVAVNDLNPSPQNIAYCLNHDSFYERLPQKFRAEEQSLYLGAKKTVVFNEKDPSSLPLTELEVDVLIDASGDAESLIKIQKMIQDKTISWAFTTHLSPDVDLVLTLGANDARFDNKSHRIISSNTCDATAIAPILGALHRVVGLESVNISILHPWLGNQNITDGQPKFGSQGGFELGRAVHGNIIPKLTSAETAIRSVLPELNEVVITALSYRVPTPIVACADLSLRLQRETKREEILNVLEQFKEAPSSKKFKLLDINFEPLVSSDFIGSDYSAIIEERLLSVQKGKFVRITAWYDNESGYAARVLDQIRFCSAGLSR